MVIVLNMPQNAKQNKNKRIKKVMYLIKNTRLQILPANKIYWDGINAFEEIQDGKNDQEKRAFEGGDKDGKCVAEVLGLQFT